MIINTEDENDQDYYDELYGEEEDPRAAAYAQGTEKILEDSKEDQEDDYDYGDSGNE
jgi:hypothetical protein